MTLKIREGGFYKRRDGVKAGPLTSNRPDDVGLEWICLEHRLTYYPNGTHCSAPNCPYDLISEWSEPAPQEAGPVRTETVTRHVIVLGTYGRVSVAHEGNSLDGRFVDLHLQGMVMVASDLRALGRLVNSLAEVLEQKS